MKDPTIEICLNCTEDDCPGECSKVGAVGKKEYWAKHYEENKSAYKFRQQTNWQRWASRPENIEKRRIYFEQLAAKKKGAKDVE